MTDPVDLTMIFSMRMLLAVTALLTLFINPLHVDGSVMLPWLVLSIYLVNSAVLLLLLFLQQPLVQGRLIYWLDVLWYGLIVFCTGGAESIFFLFFFFVILTSSFQRGLDEGARITLASCVLLALASIVASSALNVPKFLLRITFVMALGYMIAYWGGASVLQKRRLALLREVSLLSNPRFGVDHTIALILQKVRLFFGASSCILIMREDGAQSWQLRTALDESAGRAGRASEMTDAAVAPLMVFGVRAKVLYAPSPFARFGWSSALVSSERGKSKWEVLDEALALPLAELFDAHSFISVPLPLRKGEGRIFVISPKFNFSRQDTRFLSQLVVQTFPIIENITMLDRLASGAAYRERQKIARDLHDSTIQPYIGLRHGLSALHASASADNPLLPELDKLIDMSAQVIGDLRQAAQAVRRGLQTDEPELLIALRRQAGQMQKFFGVSIDIVADSQFAVSDRLAAEVFQIVNEGMSNIRKHTTARSGRVVLRCDASCLSVSIENEHVGAASAEFMPASITERAMALGGSVRIAMLSGNTTAVQIDIPV